MTRHPAKYSAGLIPVIGGELVPGALVLDPFAGTGKIHLLRPLVRTFGIELEPDWAEMSPYTLVGSALCLPFADATFDAIATSPTYGNRMADHHEARDTSRRNTYRHALGRPLHPENSGQLQWGPRYRSFHLLAWQEALRVLKPHGGFVLNISDHIRNGQVQEVTDWHVYHLVAMGLRVTSRREVPTPRNRQGANGDARVDHESVITFRKDFA